MQPGCFPLGMARALDYVGKSKSKTFSWEALYKYLFGVLKTHNQIEDAACTWYYQKEETTGRAIFGCSRVKDLWDRCGCAVIKNWEAAESMCELVGSWKIINL